MKKCNHERNTKKRQSKTEVGQRDTKLEDVLETPFKTSNKNIFTLKDNGAFSKFRQLQFAAKTVKLNDKILIGTSFGPQTLFYEQDILMEKDSSEETKGNF